VSAKTIPGTTEYVFSVEAKAGETIKAVVSGQQHLNTGVYFYAPRPEDVNGDGIATGREVSQNLVGVAGGKTPVYSEATVEPKLPEIDPVTGTLNLKKVNYKGETLIGAGFELYIITEEGKLSVGEYFVDEDGSLTVENLVPGSYELVETVVPTGYVDPEAAVKFVIDEEGKLTVEESELVSLEDGVVVVENKLIPTEITLSGIKYLDEEVAPGFSFTLSYAGQYISTVLSGDDGIFNFGSFSFDEEGTYVYTIKEVIDAEDEDILYDESEYTVTVVVTLDGAELKATVSVEKDGDAHEGDIRFDNYTVHDLPDPPPPLDPPKTGDRNLAFMMMAILAIMSGAIVFKKKVQF
jgi:pilin isopeptide linkage protein/LPXTG-motif cell wall-anchored protein